MAILVAIALPFTGFAQADPTPFHKTIHRQSADEQQSFIRAVQEAVAQGADRYAEIVRMMEAAGYTLKGTSNPEVWIAISPVIATTQPAFTLRLLPTDATDAQILAYQRQISVYSEVNSRLRFMLIGYAQYPENERVAGNGDIDNEDILSVQELGTQLSKALLDLPDSKPFVPRAPLADTPRHRELRQLITRLKQAKREAEARRAAFWQAGDETPAELRRRADLWERLADTLEETILDSQRELRGELAPAPAPAAPAPAIRLK